MPREADSESIRIPREPSISMPIFNVGNDNRGPLRFAKDDMKITKRLSIEFQHREVTLSVAGATLHVQDSESDAMPPPAFCPTCGGPWITIVARVEGETPANTDRIRHALQQSGLHLQVSPAGQLRICQRSFEAIKEKF